MTGCYVSESCSHNNGSGRFRSASIPHAGSIAQSDDFLSSFLLNGRNAGASSVSTRISPYSSISGSCFRFLRWDSSMLVYLLARRIIGRLGMRNPSGCSSCTPSRLHAIASSLVNPYKYEIALSTLQTD